MKLSRNTLRSLAVGFLASAVVTAAFALSQGQLPVQGVNGTNLLNGGSTTDNADQQAQLDALSSEKSALESTQNVLNASLTSLKEQASRQSSELEALKSHSASVLAMSHLLQAVKAQVQVKVTKLTTKQRQVKSRTMAQALKEHQHLETVNGPLKVVTSLLILGTHPKMLLKTCMMLGLSAHQMSSWKW